MKPEVRTAKITVASDSRADPSLETQDTKHIVHERLEELEKKLELITNSPQPKTKKAQDKRRSEIKDLTRSIDNMRAYLALSVGTKVTEGTQLGVITHLTFSPGGMPVVWVSWYGAITVPEQPIRLKLEPLLEQLKVGDSITINDQHPEAAHQTFEIKEFRGDGWILTTTEQLFHHDFLDESSLISPEGDENLVNQIQSEETRAETVDESVSEMIEKPCTENLEISETLNEIGTKTKEMSDTFDKRDNEQSTTTIVEIVESSTLTDTDELTDDEQRDLLHLERKVERAFYEAGKALKEIRDRQLYRSKHQTFEAYVKDRFSMKQSRSYQLMDAAIVVDNLLPKVPPMVEVSDEDSQKVPPLVEVNDNLNKVPQSVEVSNDSNKVPPMVEVLPTSERQVRPLTKLEPNQQREAWAKAVEQAGGKVPSGRIVKNIVDQIRQRTPVPNPWREGEVAMIMVKDNPLLRGKGGCWCVITEVHNFSCTVRLWDGNISVKPENLKELPYSNEQQEEIRKLSDRLTKIYGPKMEETAKAILASLGRIDRPYLTEFEERVLRVLEES